MRHADGVNSFSRRKVLWGIPVALVAACSEGPQETPPLPGVGSSLPSRWLMPDEGRPHTRTWMALGPTEDIWGADLVPAVRKNLADIAAAIVEFEPVTMLVRADDLEVARELLDPKVDIMTVGIDDLWIRDTGPVFVTSQGGALAGVDFNFNGWGDKQEHGQDQQVAAAVTAEAKARPIRSRLVLEGGALEVDGEGTAIITESCVLNDNRNPDWSKDAVEGVLKEHLGVEKVIWLPGIAGRDITDGHTDFYARFVAPGHVVAALDEDPESYDHDVTKRHLEILRTASDAKGRPLAVTTLTAPKTLRAENPTEDFAAGYINFYLVNGGVIAPEFGDSEADQAAYDTLQELFPGRKVVQVNIDGIAAGGGGIHCSTQQQPAL